MTGPRKAGDVLADPATGLPIDFSDEERTPPARHQGNGKHPPENPSEAAPAAASREKQDKPKGRARPTGSRAPRRAPKPWMQFWTAKWLGDECLRQCGLATRGAWIDLCCLIHTTGNGFIIIEHRRLRRLLGAGDNELLAILNELRSTGTAEVEKASVTSPLLLPEHWWKSCGYPVDNPVDNLEVSATGCDKNVTVTVYWYIASRRMMRELQGLENARKRQARHRALQKRDKRESGRSNGER